MKVGFIGLGKLGLPVALAVENKGHEVCGYDTNPDIAELFKKSGEQRVMPNKEAGAQELLERSNITICSSTSDVIANSDLVFLPVQTPHQVRFEGIMPIPAYREDFDYSYLEQAVREVSHACETLCKPITLVIISTVLPGTIEKRITPLLSKHIKLVYNPFFIAMGTVIQDFLNPEFVLLGADTDIADVEVFYKTIHNKPLFKTSIKTAELIKVSYNTFIGMKIVFINTLMEICHKTGAHVDDVSDALALATDRLISPKYMRAGMGDGGGCHPRDNIAMSWLASELGLSHNFFEDIMAARENQTKFLISLIESAHNLTGLPIIILGKAFKPETDLTTGSPAMLLSYMLPYDHIHVEDIGPDITTPAVYFIGTKHARYIGYSFPTGSVVIDPFRYIPEQKGVTIIKIGK